MSFGAVYTAGGRLDSPFWPTKRMPYIKGDILKVSSAVVQKEFDVEYPLEFFGVAVGASKYNTEDSWTVAVNGVPVIDTIYTKDLPEGMFFTAFIPLDEGDKITFIFNNASGVSKDVWFNYQFLKDY